MSVEYRDGRIIISFRLSAKAIADWLLWNITWEEPKDPERIGEWQRLYREIQEMSK